MIKDSPFPFSFCFFQKRKKRKKKRERKKKKKGNEIVGKKKVFPFQTVRCVVKGDCLFSSSFLVNGEVCGDYYFLFYSPFPHLVHTNTNNTNHNTNTGVLTGG